MRKIVIILLSSFILLPPAIAASDNPIVIELGSGEINKVRLIPKGTSEIGVIIRYLPPNLKEQYSIEVIYDENTVLPLTKPTSTPAPAPNGGVNLAASCTAIPAGPGGSVNNEAPDFENKVNSAKTPEEVLGLIVAAQARPSNIITSQCVADVIKQTEKNLSFEILPEYQATLSIKHIGKPLSTIAFKAPKQEWMTHVGFSFINNRGTSYYSRPEKAVDAQGVETTETVYRITEQQNQDTWLYAASALFTYPMGSIGGSRNWQWGMTGGVSANSDTVAVLFGPSVIIKKNILLNLGVVFQEFDELSGTYEVGQLLTGDAIDSTVLSKQTFKPSIAISIGFNFGE